MAQQDYASLAKQFGGVAAAPPPKPPEDYARFGPMQSMLQDQAEGGASTDPLPSVGGAVGGIVGASAGPVGAVAGATLGGMTGDAIRTLIELVRGRKPVPTAAESATSMATQGAVQGTSQAVGGAVTWSLAKAAPWLMQKAIRPSATLLNEYRKTAKDLADTMLKEGINVSPGGLEKLQRLILATNDEIKSLVANAPGTIDKRLVAARVAPVANRVAHQTNPTADLKAIGDTVDEFMHHPILNGDLSVPDAQAMKIATYHKLGKSYGEMKGAEVEAQKALARGLKEEVAEKVPGVKALNAREADLMAAGEAVGRRVQADATADPLGLLFAAENPTLFIAGLMNRQPVVKSLIARGMYATAAKAAGVPENVIRAAVYAIASGADDAPPQ